jgi:hypothetical protein
MVPHNLPPVPAPTADTSGAYGMKRRSAPGGKRVVVQKTIKNYITNNNDNRVTNNDNRVTNIITYNVRTTDGEEPSHRIDAKTGLPKTNVANVSWYKRYGKWQVRAVDAETRKPKGAGYRKEWHDAVRLREEVQKTEGTMGPGELEFKEDGEAVVRCSQCCHTYGIASYAPEPCVFKKKFAEFKGECGRLGSDDPEVAAKAEAVLAAMPDGNGGKALRTSMCRRCRDVAHKTRMEGPENASARCRDAGIEIREDMARRGCRDCGEARAECLTCEHVDRLGKPEGCSSILDYVWFAKYGEVEGPKEMWEAYRNEHVVVLCMCCHFMQPTHNSARGADSSTLKEGSDAKRHREYKEEKTAHNNKRKREFVNVKDDGRELLPGQCYYCEDEYVIVKRNEVTGQWMHKCEETKKFTIGKLVGNCLCPKTAIRRMDAEIDGTNGSGGCNLGCANCHHYYDTLPRRKEGTALWDALMAEPVYNRV